MCSYDYMLFHRVGRVGSTSLKASLKKYSDTVKIDRDNMLPIHYLSDKTISNIKKYHVEDKVKKISRSKNVLEYGSQMTKHIRKAEKVNKIINKSKNYYVITIYRDPLDIIFSFFIRYYSNGFFGEADRKKEFLRYLSMCGNVPPERALKKNVRYFYIDMVINFMDYEIKTVHGIDVYKKNFDTDSINIYKSNKCTLLLLKFEQMLNHKYMKRLGSEVFGIKNFRLNKGKRDRNSSILTFSKYYQLKKEICVPNDILDYYYNLKQVKHFYTGGEIDIFRNKWRS